MEVSLINYLEQILTREIEQNLAGVLQRRASVNEQKVWASTATGLKIAIIPDVI